MKFVFINPPKIIRKKNIWNAVNSVSPPLGLATLSALLDAGGHESAIIDASALGLGIPEILGGIDPDAVVGISATTLEINTAAAIARAVRERFPKTKILMGGVHPTIFHGELVEEGVCDMVIRGEAENAVVSLADGSDLKDVPNLTWRAPDGEIIVNPRSTAYVNLDGLPFPSYRKLPMDKYRSALGAARRSPSIGVITSRGCPGKCTFCFSGMFGSRIRLMSAGRVFEQIKFLMSEYKIREVSFYDDTFTASRRRVEALCELILSSGTDISWSCFARVDSVGPELLKLMKKAGCHQIMYGFESSDEAILKAINKKIKTTDTDDAISWTRGAGIDIRGAFMLGNPGETEESMRKTIEFSKKIGIQFAIYNITTPYPGTELFKWAKENNLLRHADWDLYDLAHPVLELPTVSSAAVQSCYRRAFREFYFRPSYILHRMMRMMTRDGLRMNLKAFKGILSLSRN